MPDGSRNNPAQGGAAVSTGTADVAAPSATTSSTAHGQTVPQNAGGQVGVGGGGGGAVTEEGGHGGGWGTLTQAEDGGGWGLASDGGGWPTANGSGWEHGGPGWGPDPVDWTPAASTNNGTYHSPLSSGDEGGDGGGGGGGGDEELREIRRMENERRAREEQERLAKEAETTRAEEDARKEAEKEARLAKMMNERWSEMEKKREEDNKKLWEKLEKCKGTEVVEGDKANAENEKRGQDEMAGASTGQPSTPRPLDRGPVTRSRAPPPPASIPVQDRPGPSETQTPAAGRTTGRLAEVFASVAGTARRMSGSLSAVGLGTPPGLGFDRVREGRKAVVANPGPDGRRQYRKDMEKELTAKYKQELLELCNKDKIKYHNKKQAVADLTAIRVRDAYGEEGEEDDHVEETTEETQEENPS
ncbi:hypothetical protein CBR_g48719 [Chara braunii]|uniref:Uncharacterized protein n=1 Tax=Chara braunii TaxID=69332 RepID=A0A388K4I8_CHABU|nr:hypothetical protein CBR_g48719 [Chara braunii]|eukprot:GBG64970.1 hypothetical protein CBR_g48719 [Chara braunii]